MIAMPIESVFDCQNRHNRHDDNDKCDSRAVSCSNEHFMQKCAPNREAKSVSGGSLTIEWYNSQEAAQFLRLSVKSLRNKTSNGEIPFYKLGRSNRYRKDELESLLLSNKRGK